MKSADTTVGRALARAAYRPSPAATQDAPSPASALSASPREKMTGWMRKTLGEVLLKTETVNPALKPTASFRYIDISSVSNESFSVENAGEVLGKDAPSRARKLVRTGDVLFATVRPTLQRICIIPDEFDEEVCSTGFFVLRPGQLLNNRYLFYYLLSDTFTARMKALQKGASYPAVNDSEVKEQSIPLPPLDEQRRIVEVLDEAFAGIAAAKATAEKNLQHARALFDSHLDAVFSQRGPDWVEKRLGDLSRINYGYTESASFEKVGPHFLRITDIQDKGVEWDTVPYCQMDACDLPKYKLADGDIVFARTGATTGKSYLVSNPPESVFASYLIRVRLIDKELLPQFVNLFFQTYSYWDTIRAGVSGSAQGGFNATKLGELVIPFPKSSKEQMTVVAKLDKISAETTRLAGIYERKLAALEALKKSLLHRAFAGEL